MAAHVNATVVAVLAVFAFLYAVAVLEVILPWLSWSVHGVANLMALTGTSALALFCYICCMAFDPGSVPPGWTPDSEQCSAVQEVKKKGGAPRYCSKCDAFKPPRSHHCRVCRRCVLRMDHHCPYTNSCIGHANYRAFFLLLLYASAALVHTTGLLLAHALHVVAASRDARVIRVGATGEPALLEQGAPASSHLLLHVALQTLALAVALPTCIAVVMLLAWHVRMVASNKTTIEHAEGVTAQIKAGLGARELRHPYDLGLVANLHAVLGDEASAWLLPSCAPEPGGLAYRTAFDASDVLGF